MVSVVLYNLTPGRGLTQPWCEPSSWGEESRQAALSSNKCLSSLCFASAHFIPQYGEAHMEFTSCPRMLHSWPTGSTETQTYYLCIQSPTHYPFGHHISTFVGGLGSVISRLSNLDRYQQVYFYSFYKIKNLIL